MNVRQSGTHSLTVYTKFCICGRGTGANTKEMKTGARLQLRGSTEGGFGEQGNDTWELSCPSAVSS